VASLADVKFNPLVCARGCAVVGAAAVVDCAAVVSIRCPAGTMPRSRIERSEVYRVLLHSHYQLTNLQAALVTPPSTAARALLLALLGGRNYEPKR
jgi:hypothetical protein